MSNRPKSPFGTAGRDLVGTIFSLAQSALNQTVDKEKEPGASRPVNGDVIDATSGQSSDSSTKEKSQSRARSKKQGRSEEKPHDPFPKVLQGLLQMFGPTEDVVRGETPQRTLDDLIVPPRVRKQLESALAGVQQHDTLYREWNLQQIDPRGGCLAISLYGPSGTGKTLCAEALANALGRQLLRVNYAQLESKFVGDTSKNIQAVFQQAEDEDAVLFFDEADSILGRRLSQVQHGVDHEINVSRSVMLQELESFSGVVLFATNLAEQYDSAFRRRMEHISLPLPDGECRNKLWRHMLIEKVDGKLPLSDDIAIEQLTERSEKLSGGDIQQVVLRSARRAVQRTGEKRVVQQHDLLQELMRTHQMKEKVGMNS